MNSIAETLVLIVLIALGLFFIAFALMHIIVLLKGAFYYLRSLKLSYIILLGLLIGLFIKLGLILGSIIGLIFYLVLVFVNYFAFRLGEIWLGRVWKGEEGLDSTDFLGGIIAILVGLLVSVFMIQSFGDFFPRIL